LAAIVRPRFYPIFALALALVVLVGFARTFYLRYWFDVPPITLLLIVHGVLFSAWMALYVIQARLIAANNVAAHMRLGIAGVALAALVFVFGMATVFASADEPRMRPMGMASYQFVFMPFFIICTFAGLVMAAVLLRGRSDLHKRLMTLAMITVLPPAIARLIRLSGFDADFLVAQTLLTAVFVICCVAFDWFRLRILHPVYLLGGALLVLSWPFRAWFARTPAWEYVGKWMAGI
jgi:hypothetical protein